MLTKLSPDSEHNDNFKKNSEVIWNLIEEKWIDYWAKNKINNSDLDYSKEKFFITVAYPYPNSPQHIGHGRTYTLADVHARYHKLKGYNVLFPMGFHYTGTPILGMSKRVQSKDKEIIDNFKKIYSIDQNTIDSFADPMNIAKYFHNEIKSGMIEMGYSIDWRREFTTIDPLYKKFISWQFKTLQNLGVIEQGSHPVGWCPNDRNPVSQHDTLGDIEPSFTEYTFIKFKLPDEKTFLPVATLRPETIFGATNLWVNSQEPYLKVVVNHDETWIVSKTAAKKLEFQNYETEIICEINGSELVDREVENPITNSLIPVLPATFVSMDDGSGIVMSVPAHAPFDMQALIDIKKSGDPLLKETVVENIMPIKTINFDFDRLKSQTKEPGFDGRTLDFAPSLFFLNKYSIKDQSDPNLEKATSDLYGFEFYEGIMNDKTPYTGMAVVKTRESIKRTLLSSNNSIIFYELTNKPVYCRCGTLCYVKVLNNQWFINYGNSRWKALAFKCLKQMEVIPDEIVVEFENVFNWLRERACARQSGLGTPLPWDKNWIIESLSDSVIYMIYYTISKYVNIKDLEKYDTLIDDAFFDYVLYSKRDKNFKKINEDGSLVPNEDFQKNENGTFDMDHLKNFLNLSFEIKREFEYFYPLDSRHSGRDLIPNHLSFFIFNHSIMLPQKHWPKQIVVNGSVLMDGKKMSNSMGNIIPLRKAIKLYSADSIRIAMLVLGELLQDVDFSFSTLKGIHSKLNEIYHFYNLFYNDNKDIINGFLDTEFLTEVTKIETLDMEDEWLLSRIKLNTFEITNSFERLKIREALNAALYLMDKDFDWYKKRKFAKIGKLYKKNKDILVIYKYLINRIKILSPFCPFLSEELWHTFGNKDSIFNSPWPYPENNLRNDNVYDENEQFISNIINDINKIVKITKNTKINKIYVYLPSKDKIYLYYKVLKLFVNSQNKNKNFGEVMKALSADSHNDENLRGVIKNNTDFIKKTIDDILSLTPKDTERRHNMGKFDEAKPLLDAISLLSSEYDVSSDNILICKEDQDGILDPHKKSKHSRPFKPAIYIQ
jgi:leucyl-tRNA synthetase